MSGRLRFWSAVSVVPAVDDRQPCGEAKRHTDQQLWLSAAVWQKYNVPEKFNI